jgi:hypothetical protein
LTDQSTLHILQNNPFIPKCSLEHLEHEIRTLWEIIRQNRGRNEQLLARHTSFGNEETTDLDHYLVLKIHPHKLAYFIQLWTQIGNIDRRLHRLWISDQSIYLVKYKLRNHHGQ